MIPRPVWFAVSMFLASTGFAQDYLVRFKTDDSAARQAFLAEEGGRLELVSQPGLLFKWTTDAEVRTADFANRGTVAYVQKNGVLGLLPNPSLEAARDVLSRMEHEPLTDRGPAYPDNPEIKAPAVQASGSDPMLKDAWGIFTVGADTAWKNTPQGKNIIVAVTDTGVDYNHTDLIANMWRNKGEIAGNGIDDDGNGYIDDIVGWDFASNDNKPYDLSLSLMDILFQGGNPGHGTHVAGVVGAQLNNALGTAGVAPQVQIMAMRFITEKGQGTTEAAIKAIDYAVANGANIINASWGGEKDSEPEEALQEAIKRAEAKGVIFVAAAGNGRVNQAAGTSAGFDNDNDPKPMVPASYDYGNMVAVAAIDSAGALAGFSNWGAKSVKVGAPGVKVLSTVPGSKFQDTIVDLGGMKVTWDGTSMAAPFVSGALAVLWSTSPGQDYATVRNRLFQSAVAIPSLSGKVATNGRIDLKNAQ